MLEFLSPAKINLWLRILGRRTDGFHDVETRMCKLAIADKVSVNQPLPGRALVLSCNVPGVPLDESNLAFKAIRGFEQKVGRTWSWQIHLEKQIPFGAGLGGGSSNAAAVLKAANELTGYPLDLNQLLEIGASIGADVPCFIVDAVAADGTGKGDQVTPVDFSWKLPIVLIKPAFPIPTPWAYRHWMESQELPGVLYAPQLCPWGEMVNSLERPVFEKHRLLPTLKMWLLEQPGVRAALMSGSGSTVFAVTRTSAQATQLAESARHYCGNTAWVQATETL